MRAISVMWAISSADLIMRSRMAGAAMSTSSMPGNSAFSRFSVSMVTWSNSMPRRLHAAGELADGVEVVVLLPVGVGDVAAEGAAGRLAAVDAGRDRGGGVGGDDEAVAAAEIAVEEVGVVVDVVVGGEERGVDAGLRHVRADRVEATLHLGGGEGRDDLRAVPGEVLKAFAGQYGAVHPWSSWSGDGGCFPPHGASCQKRFAGGGRALRHPVGGQPPGARTRGLARRAALRAVRQPGDLKPHGAELARRSPSPATSRLRQAGAAAPTYLAAIPRRRLLADPPPGFPPSPHPWPLLSSPPPLFPHVSLRCCPPPRAPPPALFFPPATPPLSPPPPSASPPPEAETRGRASRERAASLSGASLSRPRQALPPLPPPPAPPPRALSPLSLHTPPRGPLRPPPSRRAVPRLGSVESPRRVSPRKLAIAQRHG